MRTYAPNSTNNFFAMHRHTWGPRRYHVFGRQRASDFSLTTLTGKIAKFSAQKGKVVVICFCKAMMLWTRHYCHIPFFFFFFFFFFLFFFFFFFLVAQAEVCEGERC